jgi:hypothetical protein
MTDLRTALQDCHHAVDAFLAAAASVPAERWSQPRGPGKWSPGQVAEHVALAYEVNREVLHGTAPGGAAPRLLRPLFRKLLLAPVLRRRRFFPGSKSPKIFQPNPTPATPAAALGRLRTAAEAFERDAAGVGPATIDHPFFGRLPVTDLVLLQEIHTHHHRGQLSP